MGGYTIMAGEGGLSALTSLNAVLGTIIALGTVGALLATWLRWARPRWKARQARQDAFEAAILGRPAVMHPEIPGKILAHAIPGIGERQARQEEQMASLVDAVGKLADTHSRMDALEQRVDQRVEAIESRVTALEERRDLERIATRVESIQAWKTMETAINADPPEDHRG